MPLHYKKRTNVNVTKSRNVNLPMAQVDTIKVSADSVNSLIEGQHVIVYELLDKNVVSHLTGRNMGAKEKILTRGIVKRDKNSLVVQLSTPVRRIDTIGVKNVNHFFLN